MNKLITSILATSVAIGSAHAAPTVVSSNVTSDTTWSGEVILDGTIFVKDDAVLTIQAGTIVRGQPRSGAGEANAPGSLIVTQSGQVFASGSAASPIIFTTAALDNNGDNIPDDLDGDGFLDGWTGSNDTFYDADPVNNPLGTDAAGNIPGADPSSTSLSANVQLWGGLVVLGNAPTNLGKTGNPIAQVGNIEGLTASADTQYGGFDPHDSSGVLRYVSVRHGGDKLGDANEINGITLGGVGMGTIIEFCEVYMNWDDGFEWFGGTVNGNNLVATFAGDDQFDVDQGFTGRLQFLFSVTPYFAVGSEAGDRSFEFDGDDSDRTTNGDGIVNPKPAVLVYNATTIGSNGSTGKSVGDNGEWKLRNNFAGGIYNSIMTDTGSKGVSIDSGLDVEIAFSTFRNVPATTAVNPYIAAGSSNVVNSLGFQGLQGVDAAVVGGLNPRPKLSFAGVSTSLLIPEGYGMEQVAYRGAFGSSTFTSLWTTGWTALNARGVLVD